MDDLLSKLQQAELAMPLTLDELKARQTNKLRDDCTATIAAGFTADVTGTEYTYTLNPTTDQLNLMDAFGAAQYAVSIVTQWTANKVYAVNDVVLVNNTFYINVHAGTSGDTIPAVWTDLFQTAVSDGTTAWARAGMLLATTVGIRWHAPMQIFAVWQQKLIFVNFCRTVYAQLAAAIVAATTEEQVLAVTYSLS